MFVQDIPPPMPNICLLTKCPDKYLNSFLARNATVMLAMNLWAEVGLCNGATRKKFDIILLKEYLFLCYPLQLWFSLIITEVQQLPLELARTLIIHKIQGLTLLKPG